jgi:hypothetical protein
MAETRSELEKAAWGWHWEALRQSYYANHGNHRQAEACRLLADKWQQRRDALWGEAQGDEANA